MPQILGRIQGRHRRAEAAQALTICADRAHTPPCEVTHYTRGNITQAISHSVEVQAGVLRFMQQHNYTHVETRPEKWTSGRGS
jgi:hypothetical protein